MNLSRFGLFFLGCVIGIALVLAPCSELSATVTPEKEIVPTHDPEIPLWKRYWDNGRELAREGDFSEAAHYYKVLLNRKPQIEEARWEYSKVLFNLGKYHQVFPILETLLEISPNNPEYISLAGFTALHSKEYSLAVRYLGQVYSLWPDSKRATETLHGLVDALLGLKKTRNAHVLLEQLYQRGVTDQNIIKRLARLSVELGLKSKAADYYQQLVGSDSSDTEVIREAADFFLSNGLAEAGITALNVLVEREPGNLRYAEQLSSLYLEEGFADKALPLLERILEHSSSKDPDLLLVTARTIFQQKGAVEKGIYYLEYYLSLIPQDARVEKELKQAREIAVKRLSPILEHDGAEHLWVKLQTIPESRKVIFKLIADRFAAAGKIIAETAALDVLQNHHLLPNDDIKKLVSNHLTLGHEQKAYILITELVSAGEKNESLLAQKAELEIKFGRSFEALSSYKEALKQFPASSKFLQEVIRLSGELGMVQELRQGVSDLHTFPAHNFLQLYLITTRSLELNHLFVEAKKLYTNLLQSSGLNSDDIDLINYHYGQMLSQSGDIYLAERIFRKLLVSGKLFKQTVLGYMQLLQDSGRYDDSRQVLRYFLENGGKADWRSGKSVIDNELLSTYLTLLEQQRGLDKALADAEKYAETKDEHYALTSERELDPFLRTLFRLNYLQKRKERCKSLLSKIEKKKQGAEYFFLKEFLYQENKDEPDLKHLIKVVDNIYGKPDLVKNLFNLLPLAESIQETEVALGLIDEILERTPNSLRGRVSKAGLLERNSEYTRSAKEYWSLYNDFPDEPWFYKKYIEIAFRSGNYDLIIQEFSNNDLQTTPQDLKLIYTRSLWAKGQRTSALNQYRSMLTPSVYDVFEERLKESNLSQGNLYEREDTLWYGFFAEKDESFLDRLSGFELSDGFFSCGDTGAGAIAIDLYDQYGWQKEVREEYEVRNAIVKKEFIQAEKRVGKGLDDKSPEKLKDLATIYKRLEKYDKEAEVYSYLKKHGERAPEFDASIKRNELVRAPSLSAGYGISEKEGRGGEIDLKTINLSAGYSYNPNLLSKFSLEFDSLNYSDGKGSEELGAIRLLMSGNYDFNEMTRVDGGIGFHKIESGNGETTVLGNARITHHFDNILTGYLVYNQGIVNDTVESLNRGLVSREIAGGFFLEGVQGIQLGGEYRRKWYDDDFEQDRIKIWTGYFDFREYSTLNLKYIYELHRSADTGPDYVRTSDTASPYWNPGEYWSQKIAIDYKHFLSDYHNVKESRDYYAVNAYVGFENREDFIAAAQFDIFLEIKSDFLLKGELLFEHSDKYENKSASLTLIYHW